VKEIMARGSKAPDAQEWKREKEREKKRRRIGFGIKGVRSLL